MDVRAETNRIVKEWLSDHNEAYATLRGQMGSGYDSAYEMLLCAVHQKMRKRVGDDWREWLKIQDEVRHEVQRICDLMRL